jgi:serine/threonine-protein kinase
MEYAEGITLKQLLQTQRQLPVGTALDIVAQICDAVGFAHQRGIIHCDIKPQNILVQKDGQVKVTDFGIARAFSSGTMEQRGKLWGTPCYAPPELVTGKPLTPASDVYAIGIVLYEILSGKCPFEGDTPADIARQHVLNAPPPIQSINPRLTRYLCQVIDRTLSKDPAARYPSAIELGKALRAYRQHSSAATQPLPVISPPTPPEDNAVATREDETFAHEMLQQPSRSRIDWVMLLLGALAFLSAMGLLPLWGTVLTRALTPAEAMATGTPFPSTFATPTLTQDLTNISTPALLTPTPAPLVTVPDLVGQELENARQQTSEAGLILAVSGQRHSLEAPISSVLEQGLEPGAQVAAGAELTVTVSLGPEMVPMPNAVGFPALIQRLELEDKGLTVNITDTWSAEPVGLVISQTPTAGTVITVGSTVTLTVSNGQQDLVNANFGDKVMLVTCEVNQDAFRPGDALQLMITWHVQEQIDQNYTLFVHIVDRNNRIVTQRDAPPLGGSRPMVSWQPGEELFDPHTLSLPRDLPYGDYMILVGLYTGDHRLPIVDPGYAQAKGNALVVRQITVSNN